MIDYAEALTVIDVNSGSFVGRGKQARLEDTITQTNLEAAEEVVNQLRLRDIGGIIVIDFIDMARARNRDAVLKTLRKTLDEDRTKTFTAEISKLGLVEMTRQNVTEGVREIMTRPCPTCDGDGVVLSEETIAIEFERRLRELAARAPRKIEAFLIRMHPHVSSQFTGNGARVLHALEAETGKPLPLHRLRGPAPRPLRHRARGLRRRRARAGDPVPGRATRCSSPSSSRTCTRSTTPWPRSTATSSRSPAAAPTWARSASCASRRPGARRPPRCWSRASRVAQRRAPVRAKSVAKPAADGRQGGRQGRRGEARAPQARAHDPAKPAPQAEAEGRRRARAGRRAGRLGRR